MKPYCLGLLAMAFCLGCFQSASKPQSWSDVTKQSARASFVAFATKHKARTDWRKLSKGVRFPPKSNITLNAQNALDEIEGQSVAIPLVVVDVFRNDTSYYIIGRDYTSSYFKLSCTKEVAEIAAASPKKRYSSTLAAACTLVEVSSAYGRDYSAHADSGASEGYDIEIEASELMPRMTVHGECSAAQLIDGHYLTFSEYKND